MTIRGERLDAQHRLKRAVLAVMLAEFSLYDDPKAANTLIKADMAMELAARDLANIVAESPPNERPKNWDTSPDGATA